MVDYKLHHSAREWLTLLLTMKTTQGCNDKMQNTKQPLH